ncbi:MAG: exodeoxyribonuclease VII small subunit [Saprospiraceae bacterium]|nr:exodeoxyribonuclease VII small subunit [Saprospiraceae bacterium]
MKQLSLTYDQALAELEQLLEDLQAQAISVDDLATKSRRANELLAFCREKLRQIEADIQGNEGKNEK